MLVSAGRICIGILLLAPQLAAQTAPDAPDDRAAITAQANRWTLETGSVLRALALRDGRLVCEQFRNKLTGRDLLPAGAAVEEFFFGLGDPPERNSSLAGGWELVEARQTTLGQGERQLELDLKRDGVLVTKRYVIYPGSSIIREWLSVKNASAKPIQIVEPGFLAAAVRTGDAAGVELLWMTGGENSPGSWMLKTERLEAGKSRTFDSYEPFPGTPVKAPGDGVNAKILLNDKQIWPAQGWQDVANAAVTAAFDAPADVAAGDKLVFVVNMNGNLGFDTTAFDPTIAYDGGESHAASAEFSDQQGRAGWRYQYIENGQFVDLVYYPQVKQWRKALDNATGTPFVGPGNQHPDAGQDSVRVWTAPKAGHVRVTGSVCNTGNPASTGYGPRMSTSTYAPWVAVYSRETRNGAFIGWDYMGHWASAYRLEADGTMGVQFRVAGHKQTLAPGESLTTPRALVGLYGDDLDNAGNELLDWQYRYLWDYTRDGWFPAIRMLGYWMKGTHWAKPGNGWLAGASDVASAFRKVFRVADVMRYVGADVYHRDWGWWDLAGDWNGPDFKATGEYLRKYGMGQLIYAFLYTVDGRSRVAREHPDWLLGGSTLDMSRPEVVQFMGGQLDAFAARWGDFEWRNDSIPTSPRGNDDTPLLGQDAGFREVIRGFLDRHPTCAFQAVNGGGNEAGCDYTRYASSFSFSDGAVGLIRNYYAALMLPPDKTSDIPDIWNPKDYDKAKWRGLLCINFDMTGDTTDPVKLEGLRELIDIYHYLHKHGVVGRWVKVYRPVVEGDDSTMYFQRLSRDRQRGIIIPKQPHAGKVTIRPKGLLPDAEYTVSFQESDTTETRAGRDLMEKGLALPAVPAGELIYLNLPLHPGSKLDQEPPGPPANVVKRAGRNMDFPGVELQWSAAQDNNWLSHYVIRRNGAAIDKVAKGTFYFDHSAGADLAAEYSIAAVDGAGHASAEVKAGGATATAAPAPATVLDDRDGKVRYTGTWQTEAGVQPAHQQTLSSCPDKGAVAELQFEGRRVLWFSKFCADGGKAAVSVDGGSAEIADTYSADDIWGVCVWQKELTGPGRHTLRIEVLGEHNDLSSGNRVNIDGFRAEP